MHQNVDLLRRLYDSLDWHDASAMAACYHAGATFEDIAFRLDGRPRIHAMWRMICEGDIRVDIQALEADSRHGRARIVATYTFSETNRQVRNEIESRFDFEDDVIRTQQDDCDPKKWAAMAFGGIKGFFAGRSERRRRKAAKDKLDRYIKKNRIAV
jgi:hypothetical protein